MKEALQKSALIISTAKKNGATLRLIGGLAVRKHCDELEFCVREYGDIDLVGLAKESQLIIKTLVELGYKENVNYTLSSGGTRLLFEKPQSKDHVDVFLDKLRMEHDIDLQNRLDLEEITISVSDLFICKLIIYRLTEKDYRDIITIVKDLEIGSEDLPSVINTKYISELCAKSWGLHHDIITSIDECIAFLKNYHLEETVSQEIISKFNLIRNAIIDHPKSTMWKLRSHLGERYPWRRRVELETLER